MRAVDGTVLIATVIQSLRVETLNWMLRSHTRNYDDKLWPDEFSVAAAEPTHSSQHSSTLNRERPLKPWHPCTTDAQRDPPSRLPRWKERHFKPVYKEFRRISSLLSPFLTLLALLPAFQLVNNTQVNFRHQNTQDVLDDGLLKYASTQK